MSRIRRVEVDVDSFTVNISYILPTTATKGVERDVETYKKKTLVSCPRACILKIHICYLVPAEYNRKLIGIAYCAASST